MVEVKLSFTSVDEMLAYFVEQRMVAHSVEPKITAAEVIAERDATNETMQGAVKAVRQRKAKAATEEAAPAPAPEPTPEHAVEEAPVPNESASSAEVQDSAPTEASPTPAPAAPEPSVSSPVPQPEVTVEVIRAYAGQRMDQDPSFQPKMVDAIKSFGADKLSGIAKDKLPELLEKLKEL